MMALNFLGAINLVFISAVVILLLKKEDDISIHKHTISCLGNSKGCGIIFNTALIIFPYFK